MNLKPPTFPKGKFDIILCDIPWRYDSSTPNRAVENHYPTMSLEEICAIPIQNVMAKDAIVYMWATSGKLNQAFKVMEAWNLTYKSSMIWDKIKLGMGFHFRINHEFLLVATKGHPSPPLPENRFPSILRSPRRAHSQKPDEIYPMLEKMFPNTRKLEMFGRVQVDGWETYSLDCEENERIANQLF